MGKLHFGKEVSAFSLEGKFLGFEFVDGDQRKYLRLESSQGEYYYIKLAKYLRSSSDLDLQPGDAVQIFGEKKFESKKGSFKLKASRVILAGNKTKTLPSQPKSTPGKANILVCQKSDCMKRGGKGVCQALQAAISDRGLENEVAIKGTGCLKQCKAGPNVIMPDKTRYTRIQAEQVPQVMDKHFPDANVDQHWAREKELATVGIQH